MHEFIKNLPTGNGSLDKDLGLSKDDLKYLFNAVSFEVIKHDLFVDENYPNGNCPDEIDNDLHILQQVLKHVSTDGQLMLVLMIFREYRKVLFEERKKIEILREIKKDTADLPDILRGILNAVVPPKETRIEKLISCYRKSNNDFERFCDIWNLVSAETPNTEGVDELLKKALESDDVGDE